MGADGISEVSIYSSNLDGLCVLGAAFGEPGIAVERSLRKPAGNAYSCNSDRKLLLM